ncbi:MAG: Hsp20/alpha crystallin family protein [Chloroflexi bacterium]|jgi:HSP20 family protein|nr:Hsp20/alpha crystallin family protein [Chloroflexota bacterium]
MANLMRRDPFREMLSWNRAMERAFDRLYSEEGLGLGESLKLRMDVVENDDAFIVKADMAGINPDDIEITFTDNNLTIRGEVLDEHEESQEDRYHLRERCCGTFARTISMPGSVDVNKIKAETENGVLQIYLPKKEEVKPRRIEISGAPKKEVINGKSKNK